MFTGQSRDRRRYMCKSGADFGGCGGTMISATVEDLVTEAVLYRLDTTELSAIGGRQRADETTAALRKTIAADAVQLNELASLYADRQITAPEWLTARKPIEARLTANRRRQAHQAGSTVIAGHIGNGSVLRAGWPTMPLGRQAAIVRALIEHITIGPGTLGARSVDPARVEIHWRL